MEIFGEQSGEVLMVGWGGTFGALRGATEEALSRGLSVGHLHLRYLNPLPRDLGEALGRFRKVLVPEMNTGQLAFLLRGKYLVDAIAFGKVQGKPFTVDEIIDRIQQLVETGRS